ncbi:hypothetical protein F5B22DRAFT_312747 [Xylaria bambusicola]|uniref:uncharacterized protein n=1 Tax=Xylaria bambusicola TaxID=326684 RepID=UPI00200871F1|nr:uncharacterized protein F5B22DRAFT_312747 [Xylaria bambusicola]KAI0509714.1 hypothetical protein F5B22DRAFT_312747 [Xylaria bambusicola]
MAEVAAGLAAAEQIISTGVQAGVSGYAVAKPTMPLKATFSQIASTTQDDSRASLARFDHTVTIINKKAYIFGGQTSNGRLATNDIHCVALPVKDAPTPEYQALPAIQSGEEAVAPKPRTQHAACPFGKYVAIYGGCDDKGALVDEGHKIRLFDTEMSTWEILEPNSHPERVPTPRRKGTLLSHDGNLILYGGLDSSGVELADVWHFNGFTKIWNQLPHAPIATRSAAIAEHTLYLVATSEPLSSEVHRLDIDIYAQEPPSWDTISIPTNLLMPGPKPRANGALVPVITGYGRNYLLYFFGEVLGNGSDADLYQRSDLWTFQLPSSDVNVKATTNLTDAIKPAKIKDQIRSKLGTDTGEVSWAEVEVQAPGDLKSHEGKVHPGPRGSFGYDVTPDKSGVVIWGGRSGDGQPIGDGWMIQLA